MELYFSDAVTTVTTVMIVGLLIFVVRCVKNSGNIRHWGRRSAFLLVYGLVVCCFAAARDGLDKTIQYTVDASGSPGVFALVSIPTIAGCVGALMIITAAIAALIAKSQNMRKVWFYVMSCGAVLKIMVMEISRIIVRGA